MADDAGEQAVKAEELLERLAGLGHTVAVAESLTGGLVCVRLTDIPGASRVLRGGVVSYATEVKSDVLGVDAGLLARTGPVTSEVVEAMARGVRTLLGATIGLATTGEAGPESGSGAPAGTVYVAVVTGAGPHVRRLRLGGGRSEIRAGAVDGVLHLLRDVVAAE